MPDSFDQALAKARGTKPLSFDEALARSASTATVDAPPTFDDVLSAGLDRAAPAEWNFSPERASRDAPIPFEKKRELLRRSLGPSSPIDLDFDEVAYRAENHDAALRHAMGEDTTGRVTQYQRQVHELFDKTFPGATTGRHADILDTRLPKTPEPNRAGAMLNRGVASMWAPALGLARKNWLAQGGKLDDPEWLKIERAYGAPLETPGTIAAEQEMGGSGVGRIALAASSLPGPIATGAGIGRAAKALGPVTTGLVGGDAGALGMAAHAGLSEGDVGAGADAFLFTKAAGMLTARTMSVLERLPPVVRSAVIGKGAQILSGGGAGLATDFAMHGNRASVDGAVLIAALSAMEPTPRARALAQIRAAGAHSLESLADENAMLAGSLPTDGVTPSDTLRAATAQADAVHDAAGSAAEKPLRPVGAVSPESAADAARTAGERGFVTGTTTADPAAKATAGDRVKEALASLGDRAGKTARWVTSRILRPAFGVDPDSAALVAKGAGLPQYAKDRARLMVDEAAPGWSKQDRNRLFLAYSEAQHARQGDTIADTSPFKKAFPRPGDYEAFKNGDPYKEAARNLRAQFDKHVRPSNERAGAGGDISALEGPNGEFSNLIPLTADEAKDVSARGSRVIPTTRGLTGPTVPRSPNAKQRVGGADAYDYSVENQFARALAKNGDIANRLDIVDSMLKNGSAIKATGPDGKQVERPDGWLVFRPLLGKGMSAGPEGAEATGLETLYIKPEFGSPLRARFQQNLIPEEGGIGEKAKNLSVASQLLLNPAAGAFHVGLNVAPRVILGASPLRAAAWPVKALWYATHPTAIARARIAQEAVGGVRESHPASTVPYLGKFSDAAARIIDGFDVAGREAVLETVKAKQAKGQVPAGVQAQHEAMLKFGQYQRLLQDATTKTFRLYSNPFTIIAKAGIDNAHTTLMLSQGFEANTRTARLQQAAKIASIMGAYFGWNAIQNHKDTGEFFPDGIPAGSRYVGRDPKTGAPMYSWGVIGNLLGAPRVMGWTPAAAVDPIRRGQSIGRVAAAPVEAVGRDVGHVVGYFPRAVDRVTKEMHEGDWAKAVKEFPAIKEIVALLNGEDADDAIFPGFGAKVGITDEDLWKAKNPKGSGEKDAQDRYWRDARKAATR